ncbi:putative reverse transcriptase domain-containing protein [Tanacetum coccineum]
MRLEDGADSSGTFRKSFQKTCMGYRLRDKLNFKSTWSLVLLHPLAQRSQSAVEAAFQLLKQKLCSAPILSLPEGSEDFMVYCDASRKGLGAVLMKNEKFATYSRSERVDHRDNVAWFGDVERLTILRDSLSSERKEKRSGGG